MRSGHPLLDARVRPVDDACWREREQTARHPRCKHPLERLCPNFKLHWPACLPACVRACVRAGCGNASVAFEKRSVQALGSCLCAERYLGQGRVKVDPEKLRTFLLRGFGAMNALFNDHGFPESELEVMSNGIIEVIEQAGFAG